MSETNNNANGVFWCIAAGVVLLVLGGMAGNSDSSGTKSKAPKSEWCRTHAGDPWSGENDPVIQRYLRECT